MTCAKRHAGLVSALGDPAWRLADDCAWMPGPLSAALETAVFVAVPRAFPRPDKEVCRPLFFATMSAMLAELGVAPHRDRARPPQP
jgi:hypothetical protein